MLTHGAYASLTFLCHGAAQAGASLHAVSKDNFTMLMAASVGGLLPIVEQVLPYSDVDAAVVSTHPARGGYSALMYASMQGHAEVVKALLWAGADKDARATSGASALSLAREGGHEAVVGEL